MGRGQPAICREQTDQIFVKMVEGGFGHGDTTGKDANEVNGLKLTIMEKICQ
jgi:hypothetical protein